MYKYLIIGIACMVIIGSGYYMWRSGGGELIRNAYSVDAQSNLNPPTVESVTGIYTCTKKTGCNNKYTILLKEDQTFQMLASYDNEIEIVPTEEIVGGEQEERNSIVVNDTLTPNTSETEVLSTGGDTVVIATNTEMSADIVSDNININETSENESSTFESLDPLSDIESGKWGLGRGNILILTVTEQGTTTLDNPKKLIIGKIGASILSSISYNRSQYKDMIKPTFIRQNY